MRSRDGWLYFRRTGGVWRQWHGRAVGRGCWVTGSEPPAGRLVPIEGGGLGARTEDDIAYELRTHSPNAVLEIRWPDDHLTRESTT